MWLWGGGGYIDGIISYISFLQIEFFLLNFLTTLSMTPSHILLPQICIIHSRLKVLGERVTGHLNIHPVWLDQGDKRENTVP